jgi:hypothetical protein
LKKESSDIAKTIRGDFMKQLLACLTLLCSMNLFASETFGHQAIRATLGMADTTLCNLDKGQGKVISRNPVIVSYTYTLTVGDRSESISFDQDRQLFSYTSDQKTFESWSNLDGSNLSGSPKVFLIILNAKGKLTEARIGDVVCK